MLFHIIYTHVNACTYVCMFVCVLAHSHLRTPQKALVNAIHLWEHLFIAFNKNLYWHHLKAYFTQLINLIGQHFACATAAQLNGQTSKSQQANRPASNRADLPARWVTLEMREISLKENIDLFYFFFFLTKHTICICTYIQVNNKRKTGQ